MLSFGMRASFAFCTACASEAFISGSPPPSRAATWIARASFVKWAPRRASTTAFLCLIDAHLECPDTGNECMRSGPGRAAGNRHPDTRTARSRSSSVQNGGRVRPTGRVVAPRVAPQLGALVRTQPAAHPHDHLDLL